MSNTDPGSAELQGRTPRETKVRGEHGGECQYGECASEATVLVRFGETKPILHVWFCPPHAGNSIQKHDDASVVDSVRGVSQEDSA